MKYDFTSRMQRAGQDAIAVDIVSDLPVAIKDGFSVLPMWVADMNFPVCPSILQAVQHRLDQPHYGYFNLPQAYYDAIRFWQKERNAMDVDQEWIGYENGVLGGVASALQAFTQPGEGILVHSPTYIGFDHVFKNTGRVPVYSPLQLENGRWVMDYEDMEKKIKDHDIHTVLFNTPHNPTGRVWDKEEVEKAMKIFAENDCLVISDEIWSDILLDGAVHTPVLSVSEDARNRTIALYAPSKTFSLAGLVGSYHIIPNKTLRTQMKRSADATHYNNVNVLSTHALIGGYSREGMEWADELNTVLSENQKIMQDFFSSIEGVRFGRPEGTYMLYLDFADYLKAHNMTLDELLHKGMEVGVLWQDGRPFMMDHTIRINCALPTDLVKEAMERLEKFVFNS